MLICSKKSNSLIELFIPVDSIPRYTLLSLVFSFTFTRPSPPPPVHHVPQTPPKNNTHKHKNNKNIGGEKMEQLVWSSLTHSLVLVLQFPLFSHFFSSYNYYSSTSLQHRSQTSFKVTTLYSYLTFFSFFFVSWRGWRQR